MRSSQVQQPSHPLRPQLVQSPLKRSPAVRISRPSVPSLQFGVSSFFIFLFFIFLKSLDFDGKIDVHEVWDVRWGEVCLSLFAFSIFLIFIIFNLFPVLVLALAMFEFWWMGIFQGLVDLEEMVSINVYSFKKINKLTASNMFYLNNKYRAFYNKDEYFPIVPVVTELKLIIKKGNFYYNDKIAIF